MLIKRELREEILVLLFYKDDLDRLFKTIIEFYESQFDPDTWVKSYIKYINKTWEKYFDEKQDIEEFLVKYLPWIIKTKPELCLNCLRKFKQIPPVSSTVIGEMLRDIGSPELSIEHLEYLSLDYNIPDSKYHNELANSYLLMIKNWVKSLFPEGLV